MPTRAQCLKFETDQAQDVKRLEKLNSLFFTYMCGKDPHADTELDGALTPMQRTVRTLMRLTLTWLALTGGKHQPPARSPCYCPHTCASFFSLPAMSLLFPPNLISVLYLSPRCRC